jgi:hypothetical protein
MQASGHSVLGTRETLPLPHEVHSTLATSYQLRSEHFEMADAMDSLSGFPLATPRAVPVFETRPPGIYDEEMGICKPVTSRIFNPVQDRISWDFLGLEN